MKAYEIVVEKLIDLMDKGVVPWQSHWQRHKNFVTNHTYTGWFNRLVLNANSSVRGFKYPLWLTFKQAKEKGWHIKKGGSGTFITYYSSYQKEIVNEETGEVEIKETPVLRYYVVYNIEQLKEFSEIEKNIKVVEKSGTEGNRLENTLLNYTSEEGIEVLYQGDKAFYSSSGDYIKLPPKESFDNISYFLHTFAHEIVHSTGHPKRLSRFKTGWAESNDYAFEELVAEIGASFLCDKYGVSVDYNNTAAYLKGWSSYLKSAKRAIVNAAAMAEKATTFIEQMAEQKKKKGKKAA